MTAFLFSDVSFAVRARQPDGAERPDLAIAALGDLSRGRRLVGHRHSG